MLVSIYYTVYFSFYVPCIRVSARSCNRTKKRNCSNLKVNETYKMRL